MTIYCVERVLNGHSFEISPEWVWGGQHGNFFRISIFVAPEKWTRAGKIATAKLKEEIEHKNIIINEHAIDIHGYLIGTYKRV